MASLTFTVRSNRRQQEQNRRSQGGNRHPKKKPFCKVCFDAGKSEEEYTSHYLKDRPGPNGKVICPTLLATECRYCHEHGHFKSHCPALEERKLDQHQQNKMRSVSRKLKFESGQWMTPTVSTQLSEALASDKLQRKQAIPQRSAAFVTKSQFAALDDSDEEEETLYAKGPSFAFLKSGLGPSFAKAPALQGAWALKPTVMIKNYTGIINSRKAEIITELADLHKDLDAENATNSGAWADLADISEIEKKIEVLEAELDLLD